MNHFSISNWYTSAGWILCVAIAFTLPTPKRQLAVLCLYLSLISPLMAYSFYTARQELPGFLLQYDAAMAALGPLVSFLIYRYGCWMLHETEERAAKRRIVIEGPPQIEGEEPTKL